MPVSASLNQFLPVSPTWAGVIVSAGRNNNPDLNHTLGLTLSTPTQIEATVEVQWIQYLGLGLTFAL